jgi:hypothetical protein
MPAFLSHIAPTYAVALFVMEAVGDTKKLVNIALVLANIVHTRFVE